MFRDERRAPVSGCAPQARGLKRSGWMAGLVAGVLAGLAGPAGAGTLAPPLPSANSPGEYPETIDFSGQLDAFRQWLAALPGDGPSATPAEPAAPGPRTGLQFNVDPRNDSIYLGWRVPF